MKRNAKKLLGFSIGASDGEIGKVKDFYFDDVSWTIRYLVVETGTWLSGRQVLISTQALRGADWEKETFPVNLTKEQVKNSPDIDTTKPISRKHELLLHQYYPWTGYWEGGLWGGGVIGTSGMMMHVTEPLEDAIRRSSGGEGTEDQGYDPHLRSVVNVTGYSIRNANDTIGEIADFIVDDESWQISFLVADTGNWLPGKKVLLSPKWIQDMDWETEVVHVQHSAEQIKHSPEYEPDRYIDAEYENRLHTHYDQF